MKNEKQLLSKYRELILILRDATISFEEKTKIIELNKVLKEIYELDSNIPKP